MKKARSFPNTKFDVATIERAREAVRQANNGQHLEGIEESYATTAGPYRVRHDSFAEWAADYRQAVDYAFMEYGHYQGHSIQLELRRPTETTVDVKAPSRADVETVLRIFENQAPACEIAPPPESPEPEPVVFIGHGRSPQWQDLVHHLHHHHGLEIQAYEIGARAGHTIRDILDEMLTKSSFALLVMTAEDADAKGHVHPRLNVVHELGLFQGRLGFARAIVLLEAGTEEFSNIHGIHQIRFSRGNIRETFGDVLATIRREFPAR